MGFAGTEEAELGVFQVYPGRGVEGVASVASTEEHTCTSSPRHTDNSIHSEGGEGSQREEVGQRGRDEGGQIV